MNSKEQKHWEEVDRLATLSEEQRLRRLKHEENALIVKEFLMQEASDLLRVIEAMGNPQLLKLQDNHGVIHKYIKTDKGCLSIDVLGELRNKY